MRDGEGTIPQKNTVPPRTTPTPVFQMPFSIIFDYFILKTFFAKRHKQRGILSTTTFIKIPPHIFKSDSANISNKAPSIAASTPGGNINAVKIPAM